MVSPTAAHVLEDSAGPSWWTRLEPAHAVTLASGALYFSGWSYHRAFLLRFSLDPLAIDMSSLAVGFQGAAAVIAYAWLGLALGAVVMGLSTCAALGGEWLARRVMRRREQSYSALLTMIARIAFLCAGGVLILDSGDRAGQAYAKQLVKLVEDDHGWNYHLGSAVVQGVPVMQNNERVWLLTKRGIVPLEVARIERVDGRLFDDVLAGR